MHIQEVNSQVIGSQVQFLKQLQHRGQRDKREKDREGGEGDISRTF